MGLREEKKLELRRQILSTALRLYGEHGLGATRVADIATRLRISEATFFNYFPTKQAVCEEAVSEVIERLVESALSGDAPLQQQLAELTANLVTEFSADRPLVGLVQRHPEIMAAGWMRVSRPQPLLTRRVAAAQATGEVRDDATADVLGDLFLDNILMTLTRLLSVDASEDELRGAMDQALMIWSDGCKPRPSTRRRRRPKASTKP